MYLIIFRNIDIYIYIQIYCLISVSLLRDLKHANIVTLHDIIHTEKSLTLVFEYLVSNLKVRSHDTIFCPIAKRFCICGTGNRSGQVFKQFEFPFDFDTICYLFYCSHNMILIRLSDGN